MQMQHLGNPAGFFITEVGISEPMKNFANRTGRRCAMAAALRAAAYLQKCREYMKDTNNKMLVPTSYSPTN